MKLRNDIIIVAIYLLCGFAWIYFSDKLPEYSMGLAGTKYQTYKGLFYVSLTGLLLFMMLRSNNKLLDRSIRKLKKTSRYYVSLKKNIACYIMKAPG